jgi:hypothetical protein
LKKGRDFDPLMAWRELLNRAASAAAAARLNNSRRACYRIYFSTTI